MISVHHVNTAPRNFVYIGRRVHGRFSASSPLCNPYRVDKLGRDAAIKAYKRYLWSNFQIQGSPINIEIRRLVEMAKTQDVSLGCWCHPKACHGDVIKALIEYLLCQ